MEVRHNRPLAVPGHFACVTGRAKPLGFGLAVAEDTYKKSHYYTVVEKSGALPEPALEILLAELDNLKSQSVLGRGLIGQSYRVELPGFPEGVVVKVANFHKNLWKPGSLQAEAVAMPRQRHRRRAGGQQFLAHIRSGSQEFVVSTYVEGRRPTLRDLTPKVLKSMMEEMLFLDGQGVLHLDNYLGNWKVGAGGQAHMIDFDWADKLSGYGLVPQGELQPFISQPSCSGSPTCTCLRAMPFTARAFSTGCGKGLRPATLP